MNKQVATLCGALALLFSSLLGSEARANSQIGSPVNFDGSLTRSYPIEVPPFRGLEPRVSLDYRSSQFNAVVGVGWSLGAGSTIERRSPGNGTPRLDGTDVFTLDGAELIACGAMGGTHCPRVQNYERVENLTATNQWRVTSKDGTTRTYTALIGVPVTTLWGLSSVTDTHGNSVSYTYGCASSVGPCYLNEISYGASQIRFLRSPRPDTIQFASSNQLATMTERLSGIDVLVSGQRAWSYGLTYEQGVTSTRSRLKSIQRFGSNATVSGGSVTGVSALPADRFDYAESGPVWTAGALATLPDGPSTRTVLYGDMDGDGKTDMVRMRDVAGTLSADFHRANGSGFDAAITTNGLGGSGAVAWLTGDVNADGQTDIIQLWPGAGQAFGIAVYQWNGSAFVGTTQASLGQATPGSEFLIGDVDADGRADVIQIWNNAGLMATTIYRGQNLGAQDGFQALAVNPTMGGTGFTAINWIATDVNGDGRTDIVQPSDNLGALALHVHLGRGDGTFAISFALGTSGAGATQEVLVGDVTGDGLPELIQPWNNAGNLGLFLWSSTGSGFSTLSNTVTLPVPFAYDALLVADGDGDGRSDLFHVANSGGASAVTLLRWSGGLFDRFNAIPGAHGPSGQDWAAVDATGDGRADLVALETVAPAPPPAPTPAPGPNTPPAQTVNITGSSPTPARLIAWVSLDDGLTPLPASPTWPEPGGQNLTLYFGPGQIPDSAATFTFTGISVKRRSTLGANGTPTPDVCSSLFIASIPPPGQVDSILVHPAPVPNPDDGTLINSDVIRFQLTTGHVCDLLFPAGSMTTPSVPTLVNGPDLTGIAAQGNQLKIVTGGPFGPPPGTAAEVTITFEVPGGQGAGPVGGGGAPPVPVTPPPPPLNIRTLTSSAGNIDLLTRYAFGSGATMDVSYVSSRSWPAPTLIPVGRNTPTVSQLVVSDGRTAPSSRQYSYEGENWSLRERRALGFRRVVETRPDGGQTDTWYRQRIGTLAKPETIYERDASGAVYRYTHNIYEESPVAPYSSLLTARWEYECSPQIDPSCSAAATRRASLSELRYDIYGNVTDNISHGDVTVVGDERATIRGYFPNPASFVVGLPAYENSYQGIDASGLLLRQVRYVYDGNTSYAQPAVVGNVSRTQQWWGDATDFAEITALYDGFGNVVQITDATGRVTTTEYDAAQNLYPTKICNALAQCTTTVHHPVFGRPVQVTDANESSTVYTYDVLARENVVQLPDGSTRTIAYVATGNPSAQHVRTTISGPGGALNAWAFYDGFGREYLTRSNDLSQVSRVYQWDTTRVLSESAPYFQGEAPLLEQNTYDVVGRTLTTQRPGGGTVDYVYAAGQVTRFDEEDRQRIETFDAYGQLTKVTEVSLFPVAQNLVTSFTYNMFGQLRTVTDANGDTVRLGYSPLGPKVVQDDPTRGVWQWAYDEANRLVNVRDGRGREVTYAYDAVGRVQSELDDDFRMAIWNYDEPAGGAATGRLTSRLYFGGEERFVYDAMGRVTNHEYCVDAACRTFGWAYDFAGRPTAVTYPDGNAVPYLYGPSGKISSIPGYIDNIEYTARAQVKRVVHANGVEDTYAIDPARGWIDQSTVKAAGANLFDVSYTRDLSGRISQIDSSTNPQLANWTLTRDDIGRLIATAGAAPEQNATFGFDPVGNFTTRSALGDFAYDDVEHRQAATSVGVDRTYTYDGNGNRLSAQNGAIFNGYQWNGRNQLEQVVLDGVAANFRYDPEGRRIRRQDVTGVTRYFGALARRRGNEETYFIRAEGLLVASLSNNGDVRHHHSDQHGSVRATTGADGALLQAFDYRPYGAWIGAVADVTHDVGFAGHVHDDSGLIYMGARYFDPEMGRFISPDPIVPDPTFSQAYNVYAYGFNAPLQLGDDGNAPFGAGAAFTSSNLSLFNFSINDSVSFNVNPSFGSFGFGGSLFSGGDIGFSGVTNSSAIDTIFDNSLDLFGDNTLASTQPSFDFQASNSRSAAPSTSAAPASSFTVAVPLYPNSPGGGASLTVDGRAPVARVTFAVVTDSEGAQSVVSQSVTTSNLLRLNEQQLADVMSRALVEVRSRLTTGGPQQVDFGGGSQPSNRVGRRAAGARGAVASSVSNATDGNNAAALSTMLEVSDRQADTADIRETARTNAAEIEFNREAQRLTDSGSALRDRINNENRVDPFYRPDYGVK